MSTNPELELAYRFINETDRHVFLTGKAGTGKTTFLHRVRDEIGKRKVVVAPTGVAAINARGVTIHSQFQLPFGVLTPDRLEAEMRKHRLGRKKAEVLQSLDLLVIDEISMVRADVLDALGAVLRKYRRNDRPFGGVQLLMIGDLHQLPPVVRDSDWNQMRLHYKTPYFFGSLELANAGVRTVQLSHIYRQSDADFIDLLNQVRHDRLDRASLERLNSRYKGPEFEPAAEEDYITLTSHNRVANRINEEQLETLATPVRAFEATVKGNFPESMYPNDPKQRFRVGAQVMFNKNDTLNREYFNGKIGRITAIDGDRITVSCPEDEEVIRVTPVEWENRKYELNKKSKEVTDEVIGTYEQHPLRLAWAITIHKSQGLTFERVIIDAADAFAHGQVYVALSRCKTFEGIVLRSRIGDASVRTDRVVSDYSTRAEQQPPTPNDLREDRRAYQLNCLRELFDFEDTGRELARLERSLFEHETAIQGQGLAEIRELRKTLEEEVMRLCRTFSLQLNAYATAEQLPAEHPELSERLQKAGAYLLPYVKKLYGDLLQLSYMSDNQKVYEAVSERLQSGARSLLTKLRGFESLSKGFDPERYQRSKADAGLEFDGQKSAGKGNRKVDVGARHPELYDRLAAWRNALAGEQGIPPYRILHNAVLISIVNFLPGDRRSMLAVPGFGPKSYETYGEELLDMIGEFVAGHSDKLDRGKVSPSAPKEDTREVTLKAYGRGLDIAAIAGERSLSESTIRGHLAHWVEEGEVEASELVDADRIEAVITFVEAQPETPGLKEIHEHFGGTYDYGDIKIALAALAARQSTEEQ